MTALQYPTNEDPQRQGVGPDRGADQRLMEMVAAGDPRARNLLANRLCARVRRLQRMLLVDRIDADDATQESLVEIISSAGSYRGHSSIERWADRIAIRTGLHVRRRQRRVPLAGEMDPDRLQAQVDDAGWSEALPRPLAEYLHELPVKERQVLVLKHGLGYSLPEVAELVGAARSTTKYRLSGALRRIRKAIRRDTSLGVHGGGQ